MLTMELLILEQWPQITPGPFWVTFFISISSICRSIPFQALSMRVSALEPYLQSRFCGSGVLMHCCGFSGSWGAPWQGQQLWCCGSGSWLWWCSAAQECVDPAEPLAQTTSPSGTDQLWCCSPSPSPDTQKCLFATQADIYITAHTRASVLGSARQTYSCGPLHRGLLKGKTLNSPCFSSPRHGTLSFLPWFPNIRKAITFLLNRLSNLVPCQPS